MLNYISTVPKTIGETSIEFLLGKYLELNSWPVMGNQAEPYACRRCEH